MNKIARLNRGKDVLSFAREHTWQPRGGSNVHTLLPVNQRLLDRVEAENAQLRGSVVDLMLNIQALRDALGHPHRLEAENAQLRGSVVELALQVQALRDALGHPQSETQPHRPSAQ